MTALIWPLKASFVHYVSRAEGVVYVGEGAWLEDEGFVFPCSAEAPSSLSFRGTLIFYAHGGALHLELTDPGLEREEGFWSVSAAVDVKREDRVVFAEAREASRDSERIVLETTLTSAGVPLFGGNYPRGTALDPLIITTADKMPPAA